MAAVKDDLLHVVDLFKRVAVDLHKDFVLDEEQTVLGPDYV